ncbi:MAG: riboflavin synthase [Bacteroidales bacterium]|jgi:riboflavin synthase|nr:riboflavin synthase [Bacteroidales bacterium]
MFTGIIEKTAVVTRIEREGTNFHFTLKTDIASELKIDQSMAHDGVCLTVVRLYADTREYTVTAMEETMNRSNLKYWKVGTEVNLERSMRMDGRFDGHIVQGHVDQTAVCEKVEVLDGSWKFYFKYDTSQGNFTVEKGSVCINGVSLTVVDSSKGLLSVAIIPYTYEMTNFHTFEQGTVVNLEFDVLGKYIQRLFEQHNAGGAPGKN